MGEALRGSNLSTRSYETDDHVEFAPRLMTHYDCPEGHTITMPFSVEADVPPTWECRCGRTALLRDGVMPEPKAAKHVRTHWDMLLERRSIEDLEVLLEERLDLLRGDRTVARKSA